MEHTQKIFWVLQCYLGPQWLFHYTNKTSWHILQNILFCVCVCVCVFKCSAYRFEMTWEWVNVRISIFGAHWSESSLYLLIKCGKKPQNKTQCVLRDNTNDDDDAIWRRMQNRFSSFLYSTMAFYANTLNSISCPFYHQIGGNDRQ